MTLCAGAVSREREREGGGGESERGTKAGWSSKEKFKREEDLWAARETAGEGRRANKCGSLFHPKLQHFLDRDAKRLLAVLRPVRPSFPNSTAVGGPESVVPPIEQKQIMKTSIFLFFYFSFPEFIRDAPCPQPRETSTSSWAIKNKLEPWAPFFMQTIRRPMLGSATAPLFAWLFLPPVSLFFPLPISTSPCPRQ